MKTLIRKFWILPIMATAFLLTGCPTSGFNRTAKTLEPGESDFGLTFSAVKIKSVSISRDASGVESESDGGLTIPNLIPELSFHIGVAPNLEVGGRVALGSLMMELDLKYRFFQSADKKTHMAVQPAIGYRALLFIEGTHLTLPVIFTYELAPNISFTAFAYTSYLNFKNSDGDDDDLSSDANSLVANSVTAGGGFGIRYTGETFYIMPGIDFSRTMVDFNDDSGTSVEVSYVVFGLSFGWISGREMKKLKQMDRKLDRIENKLDRL
jgi:hypothetical protein